MLRLLLYWKKNNFLLSDNKKRQQMLPVRLTVDRGDIYFLI